MNTDKNTIIGFVLMALVVFAFMMYDSHRIRENAAAQQENAVVEAAEQKQKEAQEAKEAKEKADKLLEQQTDTLNPFHQASTKNEGTTVIENELLRLTINNKGGQLCKAELKDSTYKTWDKTAQVVLFDNDDSNLKFLFNGKENNIITDELYFAPTGQDKNAVTMRLPIANGSIDFAYSLIPNSYLLKLDITANNLEGFFPAKADKVDIVWNEKMRQQEKGFTFENQHSTIEYREDDNDTEVLSSGGTDKEKTEFEKNESQATSKPTTLSSAPNSTPQDATPPTSASTSDPTDSARSRRTSSCFTTTTTLASPRTETSTCSHSSIWDGRSSDISTASSPSISSTG